MKNLILPALLSLALSVAPAYAEEGAAPAAEKKASAGEKKADTAETQPAEKKADSAEAKPAHADVKAATGIENREPTGEADKFPAGTTIFVWSRVFDAKDQDVEHVWKRDDKELRRAKFHIGSVRWTVNSRQRNAKKGSYVVEVVCGEDKLGEVSFTVE
jgi:nucleoid-associated protein YgaU